MADYCPPPLSPISTTSFRLHPHPSVHPHIRMFDSIIEVWHFFNQATDERFECWIIGS